MKKLIISCVLFFVVFYSGFSIDMIDFGNSNQYESTMGFEQNEYDWMLNPVYFNNIEESTFFFSLDENGSQFGQDTMGTGFRGGYAWITDTFSPILVVNYYTTGSAEQEEPEDNVEYAYSTYDTATGTYGTITETVNTTYTSGVIAQQLMMHLGGRLGGPVNFALQGYWNMYRQTGSRTQYSNTYSDTTTPNEASLTTKGDLIESNWNLIGNSSNILAFEPEVGLNFGNIQSLIALGIGFENLGTEDDTYVASTTSYSSGVDPTAVDSTDITTYTGSYFYNSGLNSCFTMDTSTPQHVQRTHLLLDTNTTFNLEDDLSVSVPLYFGMYLYPELSTKSERIVTTFNDSTTTPAELSRTTTTTTTTLNAGTTMAGGIGGKLQKTITPSDNSALHLGVSAMFIPSGNQTTRERELSIRVQQDNNADGDYEDTGTDVDTLYTQSGYLIQTQQNIYHVTLKIPVAVSYSPAKRLTFHAGTSTDFGLTMTNSSSLITGDSGYIYETYTDNLDSTNSYSQRQKNSSSTASTPVSEFSTAYSFDWDGNFGFTLDITDNFRIDAVANSSSLEFDSFSVMCIYSR